MPATVTSMLEFRLAAPSDVILSIAVAAGTPIQHESLTVFGNGVQHPVHEVAGRHGTRLHRFWAPAGTFRVDYLAAVLNQRPLEQPSELDMIEYLRPSRYCESDELYGFASSTFGHLQGAQLVDAIARVVAVYAPGVSPMDFHAVAEAWVDGRWIIIDATRLAPRPSFVRIATGRDSADIAFLTNHFGALTLDRVHVTAVADMLPFDDYRSPYSIG